MSTCKSFYDLKKHRKYRAVLLGSVYEGTMVKLYPNPDVIKMRNVTLFGVPNKKYIFIAYSILYNVYHSKFSFTILFNILLRARFACRLFSLILSTSKS